MAQVQEEAYVDDVGLRRTLRFLKGTLGRYMPDVYDVDISGRGPNNVVLVKWKDPFDKDWAGTMVRRKLGGPPEDENDGQLVGISTIRNQYATNGMEDPNGNVGTKTYYYRFFPFNAEGEYSRVGTFYTTSVDTVITSFASLSDEDLATCIADNDAGTINLRNYWAVGDEHTCENGQKLLIVDASDHYALKDNDSKYGAFTVLLEGIEYNGAYNPGSGQTNRKTGVPIYVDDASTQSYSISITQYNKSYVGSTLETQGNAILNDTTKIPATIKNIFKEVTHTCCHGSADFSNNGTYCGTVYRQSDRKTYSGDVVVYPSGSVVISNTTDKLFVFSANEIGKSGVTSDGTLLSYFSTASNRLALLDSALGVRDITPYIGYYRWTVTAANMSSINSISTGFTNNAVFKQITTEDAVADTDAQRYIFIGVI